MPERFTPHEPSEAREPPQESKPLSSEARASMQGRPEATRPGDLNHPMEGVGGPPAYRDGQGNLVTGEMVEKSNSPERTPALEPRTYRPVPGDPAQPPNPPDTTGDTTTPPRAGLTKQDEQLLRDVEAERQRLRQEANADAAKLSRPETHSDQASLGDSGRRAMQGQPDDNFPRLSPELKLDLSTIQDMPVEQRPAAMAELFRREGKNLSNNAIVEGDRVRVRDQSGFEWVINYKE